MGLVPRRARRRESVAVRVAEHGAAAAVAGPVITGAIFTCLKRHAVHLRTGQHVVFRKVGVPVDA